MRMIPLGNRVLVLLYKSDEVSRGGIIIPDAAQRPSQVATVMEVGEEVNKIEVGDRVLVSRYAGSDVQIDDVDYKLMTEDDVFGHLVEDRGHVIPEGV